ncbi:hypothetical protein PIB30_003164 [Stylosanthes scabra]|uniref:F-box domain-containing protein n=1 Tax=Stylosanthes scabra TaxID=79078 RepID=A0ABU6Z1V4_9FABA|nr:hypothetical protein [Stylosanthes scabra]
MHRREDMVKQEKRQRFFNINDNIDILREILKRLDGPSLGVAACVCRLWRSLATNDDSLWEHLCFRHVSAPPAASVKSVVVALGGYKRLYMVCVRPVLSRLGAESESDRRRVRRWRREEVPVAVVVQLSLSLFCIDSYERLHGNNNNPATASSGMIPSDASASSLMFLCNPINV